MKDEGLGVFLSKYFRAVMIGVGVVVALCILALVALGISQINPPRTLLEINVAPSTATITINGQDYRNGIYEVEPGNYTATISADGFTGKSANITVEEGQTAKLATFLPNKSEGMAYFERSAADLNILRTLSDQEAVDFIKSYDKKLSIRDQLPLDASYDMSEVLGIPGNEIYEQTIYDGSTDSRCSAAFCLLVSGYELSLDAVRESIADAGYNLDDYEVIYDF